MIQIEKLYKKYHTFTAVKGIDLHVQAGELFGFLGPNGAGKTTTNKILAGLLKPSSGKIKIKGFDLATQSLQAKACTSFIPDRPFIYEKLTGKEFMRFIGALYKMRGAGLDRAVDAELERFELQQWTHELVESYSHGMKQRLVMASSMLHNPDLFIVDEPMVGLDPKGARLIKDLFRQLCQQGKTIFMSTHSLDVAEDLCERVAIINQGKIVALGNLQELQGQAKLEDQHLEDVFLTLTQGQQS